MRALSSPLPSAALSVEQAANYLQISRSGVWRLLREKRLPKTRIVGRTVIRRVDLDNFLESCVEPS